MSNIESEFEQHLKTLDKDTLIEWVMAKEFELSQVKRENRELQDDLFDYANALTYACTDLWKITTETPSVGTMKQDYLQQARIERQGPVEYEKDIPDE